MYSKYIVQKWWHKCVWRGFLVCCSDGLNSIVFSTELSWDMLVSITVDKISKDLFKIFCNSEACASEYQGSLEINVW